MGNNNELLNRINEKYGSMSKGQKALASYITENYDKAVFLTAAKLGEVVGVSESTVVRLATALHYKGYPQFQKALAEMVKQKLNNAQSMEVTYSRIDHENVLKTVMGSDCERVQQTLAGISEQVFDQAQNLLCEARKIYVIGIRSCAPLASYLAFYLNFMFEDVMLIGTNSPSEIFEQMRHIGPDDAIVGISFPRYSMRTLKALELANNRNAKVITLTNSVYSPVNLYSSCNLVAPSNMGTFMESLTAPMSVINALIMGLCLKREGVVVETLDQLESLWDEYQVYESDEINEMDESVKLKYARPERKNE